MSAREQHVALSICGELFVVSSNSQDFLRHPSHAPQFILHTKDQEDLFRRMLSLFGLEEVRELHRMGAPVACKDKNASIESSSGSQSKLPNTVICSLGQQAKVHAPSAKLSLRRRRYMFALLHLRLLPSTVCNHTAWNYNKICLTWGVKTVQT